MRRNTGAGKVAASFLQGAAANLHGAAGLLYNFDFDDFDNDASDLKYEHTHWLDTYAVPLLQLGPNWTMWIDGSASRIGNASYNLELSKTRVGRIWSFLLAKDGVDPSQIEPNAEGATIAVLENHELDDEHDRGVLFVLEDKSYDPANPTDDPYLLDYLAALWLSDPLNTGQ